MCAACRVSSISVARGWIVIHRISAQANRSTHSREVLQAGLRALSRLKARQGSGSSCALCSSSPKNICAPGTPVSLTGSPGRPSAALWLVHFTGHSLACAYRRRSLLRMSPDWQLRLRRARAFLFGMARHQPPSRQLRYYREEVQLASVATGRGS